jgi:hypothetical protein
MPANPREHLKIGTHERRCWTCAAWLDADLPAGAQPLGDCTRVRWGMNGVRQMTHADDVCAKHEASFGSIAEEDRLLAQGLG